MKNEQATPEEKDLPTPAPTDPVMVVTVLTNGIVIGESHHAAGKTMRLPKSQVDALLAIDPPAVRVDGVA